MTKMSKMSVRREAEQTRTRLQHAYIEVKKAKGSRASSLGRIKVILSGPIEVLQKIESSERFSVKGTFFKELANSMKITVYGSDVTFMKATFIEEALI